MCLYYRGSVKASSLGLVEIVSSVRIRIGVPPEGLGQRLTEITAWLDDNCGADG